MKPAVLKTWERKALERGTLRLKQMPKPTPSKLKKQAIELLAQAMAPDIVKLAKANMKVAGRTVKGRERRHEVEHAVEVAMDAYEPHRILMDEICDRVVQRAFAIADAEVLKQY